MADNAIIEVPDFETIFAQRKQRLLALVPEENRADIAATLELESEPLTILLQESAYNELLLRWRENEDVLSNLLNFAPGARLDELAAFYELERLTGEADERFRYRLGLHISGLSGMGTEDYYRAKALGVALWVKESRPAPDRYGTITITLWLAENAPADALAQASAILTDKRNRMATDTVMVKAATARHATVSATLYRSNGTPAARVDEAQANLQAALAEDTGLGATFTRSWLTGRLSLAGIADVDLREPLAGLVCADNEYPVVTLDIRDGGLA